jgi:hypothetical protein
MTRSLSFGATLLLAQAACAAEPALPPNHPPPAGEEALFAGPSQDLRLLAERAYVWGMPLVEAELIRSRFKAMAPLNRFFHRRALSGPEMRAGVGPNNDTLYSLTWVDLSEGPLVVTTPNFGDRYYTISINQADSSSNQSLGQRTHGGRMPPLFVHGPDWTGPVPAGMVAVPVSTRFANLAGRILVRGPEEYAEVHVLQDQMTIYRWRDWQAGNRTPAAEPAVDLSLKPDPAVPDELRFLDLLGQILRYWQARDPGEAAMIASFAPLGLGLGVGFDPGRLSPAARTAAIAGLNVGRRRVAKSALALGTQRKGWTTNFRGSRFGEDWLLRAAVAKDQIFVAVPEEAIYPVGRVDSEGRPLSGAHRYRIHFASDALPPVQAFWSVTAYDDNGFMVPNPMRRYSIGDRSPGLRRHADGGITIELAKNPPPPGDKVNWLPVSDGPFYLMMRLYVPRAEVLQGKWVPPAITRLD